MAGASLVLLVLIVLALLWPYAVIAPLAVLGGWIGVALLIKAYKLWSHEARLRKMQSRRCRASGKIEQTIQKNLMSIYDREPRSIDVQGARGDGASAMRRMVSSGSPLRPA
jgi:hypothetical protein